MKQKTKRTKTIREVRLSLPKGSTKADLLKELKKNVYSEQDFYRLFYVFIYYIKKGLN